MSFKHGKPDVPVRGSSSTDQPRWRADVTNGSSISGDVMFATNMIGRIFRSQLSSNDTQLCNVSLYICTPWSWSIDQSSVGNTTYYRKPVVAFVDLLATVQEAVVVGRRRIISQQIVSIVLIIVFSADIGIFR